MWLFLSLWCVFTEGYLAGLLWLLVSHPHARLLSGRLGSWGFQCFMDSKRSQSPLGVQLLTEMLGVPHPPTAGSGRGSRQPRFPRAAAWAALQHLGAGVWITAFWRTWRERVGCMAGVGGVHPMTPTRLYNTFSASTSVFDGLISRVVL